jgi:hypothetical protein
MTITYVYKLIENIRQDNKKINFLALSTALELFSVCLIPGNPEHLGPGTSAALLVKPENSRRPHFSSLWPPYPAIRKHETAIGMCACHATQNFLADQNNAVAFYRGKVMQLRTVIQSPAASL